MHILTSALWRGVFMSDESIKEPHVRALAEYIDSELADIYAVDVVRVAVVCIISYPMVLLAWLRWPFFHSMLMIKWWSSKNSLNL